MILVKYYHTAVQSYFTELTTTELIVLSVSYILQNLQKRRSVYEGSYKPLRQCDPCCAASTDETSA